MIPDQSIDTLQLFSLILGINHVITKRRIVQPAFVQMLRPKLKIGGVFPWRPIGKTMRAYGGSDECGGRVCEHGNGWYNAPRPDSRPLTKFEHVVIVLGHGVWDLLSLVKANRAD